MRQHPVVTIGALFDKKNASRHAFIIIAGKGAPANSRLLLDATLCTGSKHVLDQPFVDEPTIKVPLHFGIAVRHQHILLRACCVSLPHRSCLQYQHAANQGQGWAGAMLVQLGCAGVQAAW